MLVKPHDEVPKTVLLDRLIPLRYFPVWARVGKRRHRGWVHIPAAVTSPVAAIADDRAQYPAAG